MGNISRKIKILKKNNPMKIQYLKYEVQWESSITVYILQTKMSVNLKIDQQNFHSSRTEKKLIKNLNKTKGPLEQQ